MRIKAKNCKEVTEKAIDSINNSIEVAKTKDFTTAQVNALNTGNIVQILGAIANSLAEIADSMKGGAEDCSLEIARKSIELGRRVGRLEGKLERPKGEWILLSEKQPQKSGYYITSTIYNQVYCDYWSVNHFERTETVLAWQPLPESYKVGGEQNEDS